MTQEQKDNLGETSKEIEAENLKCIQQDFCMHLETVYLCPCCGEEPKPIDKDYSHCRYCGENVEFQEICTNCEKEV